MRNGTAVREVEHPARIRQRTTRATEVPLTKDIKNYLHDNAVSSAGDSAQEEIVSSQGASGRQKPNGTSRCRRQIAASHGSPSNLVERDANDEDEEEEESHSHQSAPSGAKSAEQAPRRALIDSVARGNTKLKGGSRGSSLAKLGGDDSPIRFADTASARSVSGETELVAESEDVSVSTSLDSVSDTPIGPIDETHVEEHPSLTARGSEGRVASASEPVLGLSRPDGIPNSHGALVRSKRKSLDPLTRSNNKRRTGFQGGELLQSISAENSHGSGEHGKGQQRELCKLLNLPKEVREEILSSLLVATPPRGSPTTSLCVLLMGDWSIVHPLWRSGMHTNILSALNREVYQEAMQVLYGKNVFRYMVRQVSPRSRNENRRSIPFKEYGHLVRKVEIELERGRNDKGTVKHLTDSIKTVVGLTSYLSYLCIELSPVRSRHAEKTRRAKAEQEARENGEYDQLEWETNQDGDQMVKIPPVFRLSNILSPKHAVLKVLKEVNCGEIRIIINLHKDEFDDLDGNMRIQTRIDMRSLALLRDMQRQDLAEAAKSALKAAELARESAKAQNEIPHLTRTERKGIESRLKEAMKAHQDAEARVKETSNTPVSWSNRSVSGEMRLTELRRDDVSRRKIEATAGDTMHKLDSLNDRYIKVLENPISYEAHGWEKIRPQQMMLRRNGGYNDDWEQWNFGNSFTLPPGRRGGAAHQVE